MRRIMAFLLVMVILAATELSEFDTKHVSAADSKAEKVITALGIMKTDKGLIASDTNKITRSQFAQLLVNLSIQKDTVSSSSNVTLFSDVPKKYWAAGYIKTAVLNGWMTGYLNGSFKPNQGITLIEAINGVLHLLGYTDSDFSGNAAGGKLALYHSKELDLNITVSKNSANLSYSNCINLFYNTLNATAKDGKNYAETLGYKLDTNGELDYMSLMNTGTTGPIVAEGNWASEIPFSIYKAIWYKNDVKCSYTDINEYDILYYSEGYNTVWAYDTKITGTIQAISPDLINPTSVTVSGTEYQFETSDAALEFSSLGNFDKGDVVTLLLGKSGKVAGALHIDEYNVTITGVVLGTGTHVVQNKDGSYSTTDYITYVDASGNTYTQDYDAETAYFTEGDLARITYKDGNAAVSKYICSPYTFGGYRFSEEGTYLGDTKLASSVQILDLYNGEYIRVNPARLANVTLTGSCIYYYELNASREISKLILNGVTGDLDQYGVYTGVAFSGSSGSYSYILDGKAGVISNPSNGTYSFTEGPVGFTYSDNTITGSYSLTGVEVTSIGYSTLTADNKTYPLADKISVYQYIGGEYIATTLDKVSDSANYKLTAYYDKAISFGGRVRVIVAVSRN